MNDDVFRRWHITSGSPDAYMTNFHRFQFIKRGNTTSTLIDGQQFKGVRSYTVSHEVGQPRKVTLEMFAEDVTITDADDEGFRRYLNVDEADSLAARVFGIKDEAQK